MCQIQDSVNYKFDFTKNRYSKNGLWVRKAVTVSQDTQRLQVFVKT